MNANELESPERKHVMWYKVKELSSKGLRQAQICRETGLDKKTVSRYLRMTYEEFVSSPSYRRMYVKPLDQYEETVRRWLDAHPDLSNAQIPDWLRNKYAVLPSVNAKTVFNFVRYVRTKYEIRKPSVREPRQYAKVEETGYGEFAQADFGEKWMRREDGRKVKVYFFVMVLCRNHKKYVWFSSVPFMSAVGGIYPMDAPSHPVRPTPDMTDEWNAYRSSAVAKTAETVKAPEPNLFTKTVTLLERIRTNKRWSRPTVEKDGLFVDSRRREMAMTFIHNHDNLLLTGPSGTGKTELVLLVCKRLGLECHKYNMGTMSDPMSALLGVHRIKDGKSVFEPAQFLEDIQKPGVILLDEINRAPLNALNYLMSCLDGTRKMRNDYISPVQTVKVHPECAFVATANIGAEFVGTNILDPALNSRFFRLQMDYPTASDEADILSRRCGIPAADALNIAKVAKDIRSSYAKSELSATVTVRQTLMAAKLVACGYTALEALAQIFLPYFEGTPSEGEMGIVNKMFCAR